MNRALRNFSAFFIPLVIIIFLATTDITSLAGFIIMFTLGTIIASIMEDKKLVLETAANWAIILSLTFGIIIFSFSIEFTFNSIEYYFFIYGPPILISLISYPITKKWTSAIKAFGIIFVMFLILSFVIVMATGMIGDGLKLQCLFMSLWVVQSTFVALLAYLTKKAKNMAMEKIQKGEENKGKSTSTNKPNRQVKPNKHKSKTKR